MMKINILITAIGCNNSISVMKGLKLLKKERFKIIGTDIYDQNEIPGVIFCDKVYKVPTYNNKAFIDVLLEICKKEKIFFLIPIVDQEVEIISKYKDKFEKLGVRVCCSNYKTNNICNDKYKTYVYLKGKNIVTPRVYLPNEIDEIKKILPPYFIKPRKGRSSMDCYKANSFKELEVFLKKVKDPIIQEVLKGEQYVIDVINDLEGRNLVSIPRHEILAKAGIGVKAKTIRDLKLIQYGQKISEAIGINGTANIEVFKDKEKISLIEINPRFSAGAIISIISGINIPEIII